MSYIGSTPTTQSFIAGTDYFNGNGSTTAFTLSRNVVSTNDIQATVNNVVQQPNDAYTVSGNTITFTSAPSAGTGNVYVRYMSTTTQSITPSQGTVSYSTLNTDLQSGGYASNLKNRIINGAMVIDQRNNGASVSFTSSFAYYLDRFGGRLTSSSGSTIAQSSTAPTGFNKSLLVTIGTGASATAGQLNAFYQAIEGYNTADLGFGTANAKPITLSFWVRSSLTGTFGGSFQNNANNRSYPFTYTINSANTWEFETITIAGDTTGTWETTNSAGLTIWFDLGSGSNYQGTAGAWAGADYRAASGTTSLVATSGATINITGVQLEKGSTATSFDYRSIGTELALCQRYYEVLGSGTMAVCRAGNTIILSTRWIVSKRASPTMGSLVSTLSISNGTGTNISMTSSALGGAAALNSNGCVQDIFGTISAGAVTNGQAGVVITDNFLSASAEL